jgi:hypothetical protein
MEMHVDCRPSDVSYWRAESVNAIVSEASTRYGFGQGVNIFDAIREKASNAQANHEDATLRAMLEEYAPGAEQLTNYPG